MNSLACPQAPSVTAQSPPCLAKAAEAEQSRFAIFPNEPNNKGKDSTELGSWFFLLLLYLILEGGVIERKSGGGGPFLIGGVRLLPFKDCEKEVLF